MGNNAYIWEMAPVSENRLKNVGNDLDVWEMPQICVEMTYLFDKRLKMWKMI